MQHATSISVSCNALSETILEKAKQLAKKLSLPFCPLDSCASEYVLLYTDTRLELHNSPVGRHSKPLVVDFLKGAAGYRHRHDCTIQQPLAKAVGIKPGFRPDVFDATAGLGGDGFVLASLGCTVTLNERSEIIGALLADGLARAAAHEKTADIIARLHLHIGDAITTLHHLNHLPHTIYLDPMYPHCGKTALNKKQMRMIRAIVGDDTDSPVLLELALQHATNRVVVKRPKGAPHLTNLSPTHCIKMKNSRFDVYLIAHL